MSRPARPPAPSTALLATLPAYTLSQPYRYRSRHAAGHSPSPAAASRFPALKTLRNSSKTAVPGGCFSTLTHSQRIVAEQWLWKFTQRWGSDLPPWRLNILRGVAKRLALHPPELNFAHSLAGYKSQKTLARRPESQAAAEAGRQRGQQTSAANQFAKAVSEGRREPLPVRQLPLA